MTIKNNINWPAVEKFIDEYSNSYEMIGEDDAGREGTYNPSESEIYMISDAIRGLLDDEDFLSLLAAPDDLAVDAFAATGVAAKRVYEGDEL